MAVGKKHQVPDQGSTSVAYHVHCILTGTKWYLTSYDLQSLAPRIASTRYHRSEHANTCHTAEVSNTHLFLDPSPPTVFTNLPPCFHN
jgi:hypothetical protein